MLNIKEICRNPETYRELLKDRIDDVLIVDNLVQLNEQRKKVMTAVEELKRQRNLLTQKIGQGEMKEEEKNVLLHQSRTMGQEIKLKQKNIAQVDQKINEILPSLPNIPHISVPPGKDENTNLEVRRKGEPRSFAFAPCPHWEIGSPLGLDLKRGVQLAGSRFYLLRGDLARLEMALIQMMIDQHVDEHGYELVIPPYMVNRETMVGCGQLPKFQNELYRTEDDLYLVPTAESALASFHANEILQGSDLPKKYVSFTPCFRREAGAAGRDTRGAFRVHQFHKVELFQFTTPDQSYEQLEILVTHAESILKALELPYRVVLLSAGDMGFAAAKTYDLEVWLPSQNRYREISSCSNTEAFQARRTNTRFRATHGGKPEHVHLLNGSGLAVGRTMIAILENYQQEDGSVLIPKKLQKYMGNRQVITPVRIMAVS